MYIEDVPNRKSRPAILLRSSRREGRRTIKTTLANLTDWPEDVVAGLRRLLDRRRRGLALDGEVFAIERSIPHGHVRAALALARRIGLDALIDSRPSRRRDLVLAMVVERLIDPGSKLATTRLWHTTTLARELGVEDASVDELYAAMDWLSTRQRRIERKLASRHLGEGSLVLYDVSSSYYEGRHCPLAGFGHNRDRKKGRPIIVYGLLCDAEGRPVAVQTYPGNTGDPTTVPDMVERLRGDFGLERVVVAGDRGMLTESQIKHLKTYPQLGWISALRSKDIAALARAGAVQMSLFDEQNLAEIVSPDFPGERLIVCYNPLLAEERTRKRAELIAATKKELDRIRAETRRRTKTPLPNEEIGLRVGRVINKFKVAKHFQTRIERHRLHVEIDETAVAAEQALDGIYILRTSESAERLDAPQTVRAYKSLTLAERAFRTMKTIELLVRPIFHRSERRVPVHIFLCMLAYYLEWHLRKAWKPLLFDDEDLDADRQTRDPVAPARPSDGARRKKAVRQSEDGLPLHSFPTLMAELGTLCKNRCRFQTGKTETRVDLTTEPTEIQARAFHLIDVCPVNGI